MTSTTPPTDLIDAVRSHADTVLENGRDEYGAERTGLLADAIDPETGTAVPYDPRDVGDDRRLSNLSVQQPFLRTLAALTATTGDANYRDSATDVVSRVFADLTDDAGLLYWGGHAAYDLDADEVVLGKDAHELKWEYPFYDLLWDVDADATRRFVESFWSAHVSDPSILDFNRHGDWNHSPVDPWAREYEGGDVFFWGDGLTFVNTGSDLYYAAGLLAEFTGEDAPLRWAERLAGRYVETRGETGISGYQFSQHASWCDGPEIRGDRAQYQFDPYIPGDHWICEGSIFRPRPVVQRRQLELGDRLGERGDQFVEWAVEELRAWYEAAYRPAENTFEPMLTDGYSLEGFVIRREGYYGPKGRIIGPIDANASFLWTYVQAVRRTGDGVCWTAAREIAAGLGLGEIGAEPGADPELEPGDAPATPELLYALLELRRATGDEAFLEAAADVGRRLLADRFSEAVGAFTDDEDRVVLDDPVPLALVHLAVALEDGDATALPTPSSTRTPPAGGV